MPETGANRAQSRTHAASRAIAWANLSPIQLQIVVDEWMREAQAPLSRRQIEQLTRAAQGRKIPLAVFRNWIAATSMWTEAALVMYARNRGFAP